MTTNSVKLRPDNRKYLHCKYFC